jgi:hypothetical protein
VVLHMKCAYYFKGELALRFTGCLRRVVKGRKYAFVDRVAVNPQPL